MLILHCFTKGNVTCRWNARVFGVVGRVFTEQNFCISCELHQGFSEKLWKKKDFEGIFEDFYGVI